MNTLSLHLELESILVNSPVCFRVKVNNTICYDSDINTRFTTVIANIPNSASYRVCTLGLELYNKNNNNTVITNGILSTTASISIKSLFIDNVALITNKLISDCILSRMTYTHDTNGNTDEITEPFTRHMGCNGIQTIKMYTPLHMWLYEVV